VYADGVLYGSRPQRLVARRARRRDRQELWVHEGLNGITSKGINLWQSA
jgi:hypothetical protein